MKAKQIFGILLILAGIIGGAYVGFWLMFVGGIIDVINAVKAPITSATDVGFGALKIIFSGAAGWATFWFCTFIGAVFIAD